LNKKLRDELHTSFAHIWSVIS